MERKGGRGSRRGGKEVVHVMIGFAKRIKLRNVKKAKL